MAGLPSQNQLPFERDDHNINDKILEFYDSSDYLQIGSTLLLKPNSIDVTLTIPHTDLTNEIIEVGQKYLKRNTINLFNEEYRNPYVSYDIEKSLYFLKNIKTYSQNTDDRGIYNKFENYINDNTSRMLLSYDLSTILSKYSDTSSLTNVLNQVSNSFVKHLFNIKNINILTRRSTTYSESINYYNDFIKSYFLPQTDVLKSSIAINNFLYDLFSNKNRNSFILFDCSNDSDVISIYFYNIVPDNTNMVVSLYKYTISQRWYHYVLNQRTYNEFTYKNTSKTKFDFVQQNYSMNNGSDDTVGNISIIRNFNDTTDEYNLLQFVYSGCNDRNFIFGGKISDYTFSLENVTTYSSIKSTKCIENKQHEYVSDNSYTSLYTLNIVTSDNKNFNIPFVIDFYFIDNDPNLSVKNVIETTKCTLFNQNELNSKFDNTWEIKQNIYDITSVLSSQSFDSNTNVLTNTNSSIVIANKDHTISIISSENITKVGDKYLNQFAIFDRKLIDIEDNQNSSLIDICDNISNNPIKNTKHTPLGTIKNGSFSSNIQKKTYVTTLLNDVNYLGSFENSIIYGIQKVTDVDTSFNLVYSNLISNFTNDSSYYTTLYTSDITNLSKYGFSGFYNSLTNKAYIIFKDSTTTNLVSLYIQNLDSSEEIKYTLDETPYMMVDPQAIYHYVDETSLMFVRDNTINYGQGYSKILFNKDNFLQFEDAATYIQNYHGFSTPTIGEIIYDVSSGIDLTRIQYDEIGNKYIEICDVSSYNGTSFNLLTKKSFIIDDLNRWKFNSNYTQIRVDRTTAWGFHKTVNIAIKFENNSVKYYDISSSISPLFPFSAYDKAVDSVACSTTVFSKRSYDTLFFIDSTTQMYTAKIPENVQYSYQHIVIDDINQTITSVFSDTGRIQHIFDNTAFILYEYTYETQSSPRNCTFKFYNIDDRTVSLSLTDLQNYSGNIYFGGNIGNIISACYDDGTYHVIGVYNSEIYFTDFTYIGSQEFIRRVKIKQFPKFYSKITSNNDTDFYRVGPYYYSFVHEQFYGNSIECVNDNTYYIQLAAQDTLITFEITDSSTTIAHTSVNFQIDEDVDIDYKNYILGNKHCVVKDLNLNIIYGGSPFIRHGVDSYTDNIIFKKWYEDEKLFDYIISPLYTSDTSSILPNKITYQLFNNEKNYFVYPYSNNTATVLYKRGNNFFPKTNPIQQSVFINTSTNLGQSRENYGYSAQNEYFNLFKYNEDIIGFVFDAYKKFNDSTIQKTFIGTKYNLQSNQSYEINYDYLGKYSSKNQSDLVFSYIYDEKIYIYSSGSIFYYDIIQDVINKVNVYNGYSSEISGSIGKRKFSTNHYISGIFNNRPYIYSLKQNRWFNLPNNPKCTPTSFDVFVSDKNLFQFNYGIWSPTSDSYIYNKSKLTSFNIEDLLHVYIDDNSNVLFNDSYEKLIITKPKFYNNIFTSDICPYTFDKELYTVYTCIDDSKQFLGFGSTYDKNKYDKLSIFNTIIDSSEIVRTCKLNNEICLNYNLLKSNYYNASISGYSFNNNKNIINSNVYLRISQDFTPNEYEQIDTSTVNITGIISTDYTIGFICDYYDIGFNNEKLCSFIKESSIDIILSTITTDKTKTCTVLTNFSNLDQSGTLNSTVKEVNDFFISLDIIDQSDTSESIILNNPDSILSINYQNKLNWLATTSYYKINDNTINCFVFLPLLEKVIIIPMIYYDDEIYRAAKTIDELYNFYDFTFSNYFNFINDVTINTISSDLQYFTPISFISDTNVLQAYSDLSNILKSLSLIDGTTIQEYTNISMVSKEPFQNTFKIIYDMSYSNDFIRYSAILDESGSLLENNLTDVITSYILNNKSMDVSDVVVSSNINMINLKYSGVDVSNINLGGGLRFNKVVQKYDTTKILQINADVHDIRSHTNKDILLIFNKDTQNYVISNGRFSSIIKYDYTQNNNQFFDNMFYESNGIIRNQCITDYPLSSSNIISQYNDNEKSINYFDPFDGLVYEINNINVYDGVILYKDTIYTNTHKEFIIYDLMHPSMQYHDDLPLISFSQYEGSNFLFDYAYDSSRFYIFTNICPSIEKISLNIQPVACIDYDFDLVNFLDASYYRNDLSTYILFDITSMFPIGCFVLKRKNRTKDVITDLRKITITVDYTYEIDNLINYDITSLVENPFGSFNLYLQNANYLNDNSYYNDFTNNSDYINKQLSPYFDQHPITVNDIINNSVSRKLSTVVTKQLDSTTFSITYLIDTDDWDDRHLIFFFNMGENPDAERLGTELTEITQWKLTYPLYTASIKLTYNTEIFEILEKNIITREREDWYNDVSSIDLKHLNQYKVKFTPHSNRMNWYVNEYLDSSLYYKTHNHSIAVYNDITNKDSTNFLVILTKKEEYPYDFDQKEVFNDESITSYYGIWYNIDPSTLNKIAYKEIDSSISILSLLSDSSKTSIKCDVFNDMNLSNRYTGALNYIYVYVDLTFIDDSSQFFYKNDFTDTTVSNSFWGVLNDVYITEGYMTKEQMNQNSICVTPDLSTDQSTEILIIEYKYYFVYSGYSNIDLCFYLLSEDVTNGMTRSQIQNGSYGAQSIAGDPNYYYSNFLGKFSVNFPKTAATWYSAKVLLTKNKQYIWVNDKLYAFALNDFSTPLKYIGIDVHGFMRIKDLSITKRLLSDFTIITDDTGYLTNDELNYSYESLSYCTSNRLSCDSLSYCIVPINDFDWSEKSLIIEYDYYFDSDYRFYEYYQYRYNCSFKLLSDTKSIFGEWRDTYYSYDYSKLAFFAAELDFYYFVPNSQNKIKVIISDSNQFLYIDNTLRLSTTQIIDKQLGYVSFNVFNHSKLTDLSIYSVLNTDFTILKDKTVNLDMQKNGLEINKYGYGVPVYNTFRTLSGVTTIRTYNLYCATQLDNTFKFKDPISVIDDNFYIMFVSDNETSLDDDPIITLTLYYDNTIVHQQYTTGNITKLSLAYNSTAIDNKCLLLYPLLENGSGISKSSTNKNINKFNFNIMEISFKSRITEYKYYYQYSYVYRSVDNIFNYFGSCSVNYFPIYNIDFIYNTNDYNEKITEQNIPIRNRSGSVGFYYIPKNDSTIDNTEIMDSTDKIQIFTDQFTQSLINRYQGILDGYYLTTSTVFNDDTHSHVSKEACDEASIFISKNLNKIDLDKYAIIIKFKYYVTYSRQSTNGKVMLYFFTDDIDNSMTISEYKYRSLSNQYIPNCDGNANVFFDTENSEGSMNNPGYYDVTILVTSSYQQTHVLRHANSTQTDDRTIIVATTKNFTDYISHIGFDVNGLMGIGDLTIDIAQYKFDSTDSTEITLNVVQLGNANAKEFDIINFGIDSSARLFGTDGTYDVSTIISNTGEKTIINVSPKAKKIIIRNIKPKENNVIPTISINSSKFITNNILNNITIECEKAT